MIRNSHSFYTTSTNIRLSGISPLTGQANAEIFRLTKNNLKYTADVSENKLLPQLDLVGEYTKKSEDETFSKVSGKSEFNRLLPGIFIYPSSAEYRKPQYT